MGTWPNITRNREWTESELRLRRAEAVSLVLAKRGRPDTPELKVHMYRIGSVFYMRLSNNRWCKAFVRSSKYIRVVEERKIVKPYKTRTEVPFSWMFNPKVIKQEV